MSRVTSKGQVTIPKEIRDELGLQPGDEVRFEATDEGFVLRKEVHENRFEKWRGAADADESVSERMQALRGNRPWHERSWIRVLSSRSCTRTKNTMRPPHHS